MIKYPKIGDMLLSEKVKNVLFKMMKQGDFDRTGHLPPEAEIALKLGVSRTVIRDVYRLLETEGYIIRRRGIGTLINYNVLRVKVRLDIDHKNEFYDLVREANHAPSTGFLRYKDMDAPDNLPEEFGITPGEKILCIERLILADSIAVIYCRNYFPKGFLSKEVSREDDFDRPIFEFLEKYCKRKVHHEISNVRPIMLAKDMISIFQLSHSEPALLLKEIAYDIDQHPVLYSEEFHRSGILNHTLLRRIT